MNDDICIVHDPNNPCVINISYNSSKRNKTLINEIRLSILSQTANRIFSEDQATTLVNLTTYVNPGMEMGRAVELYDSGLLPAYMTDDSTRILVDLWWKSEGYAGLTLAEFMASVRTNKD